jgi:hypothetical protein
MLVDLELETLLGLSAAAFDAAAGSTLRKAVTLLAQANLAEAERAAAARLAQRRVELTDDAHGLGMGSDVDPGGASAAAAAGLSGKRRRHGSSHPAEDLVARRQHFDGHGLPGGVASRGATLTGRRGERLTTRGAPPWQKGFRLADLGEADDAHEEEEEEEEERDGSCMTSLGERASIDFAGGDPGVFMTSSKGRYGHGDAFTFIADDDKATTSAVKTTFESTTSIPKPPGGIAQVPWKGKHKATFRRAKESLNFPIPDAQ